MHLFAISMAAIRCHSEFGWVKPLLIIRLIGLQIFNNQEHLRTWAHYIVWHFTCLPLRLAPMSGLCNPDIEPIKLLIFQNVSRLKRSYSCIQSTCQFSQSIQHHCSTVFSNILTASCFQVMGFSILTENWQTTLVVNNSGPAGYKTIWTGDVCFNCPVHHFRTLPERAWDRPCWW